MLNLRSNHWWAVVFAILCGFITVAPSLGAIHAAGTAYQGIPFMPLNNEEYYLARIQEISDGHGNVSSPEYFEYKNSPAVIPPVGEYLYVGIEKLFGASPAEALVVGKFLFPTILFLLVYSLMDALLEGLERRRLSSWLSIAAAATVVLGYDIVDIHRALQLLTGNLHAFQANLWTRPVNPITGALFLFAFLNTLWHLYVRPRASTALWAGLFLALCIGYIFAWAIAIAITFVIALYTLLQKDYLSTRYFALAIVIGIILDSLPLIHMFSSDKQKSLLNGLILGHAPIINKIVFFTVLICALLIAILIRKKGWANVVRQKWLVFTSGIVIASVLVFNEQLLTGKTIWPAHFVQYTIPLCMISVFVCIAYVFQQKKVLLYIFSGLIIVTTCGYATQAALGYSYDVPSYIESQRYAEVFDWLNSHASKDCVVLVKGNEALSRDIPAFTSCNVYTSGYIMTGVPEERRYHNLLVIMKLADVKEKDAHQYLEEHEPAVREYFFTDWNTLFGQSKDPQSEMRINELVRRYHDFLKTDFTQELKKYRIDYLILPNGNSFKIQSI